MLLLLNEELFKDSMLTHFWLILWNQTSKNAWYYTYHHRAPSTGKERSGARFCVRFPDDILTSQYLYYPEAEGFYLVLRHLDLFGFRETYRYWRNILPENSVLHSGMFSILCIDISRNSHCVPQGLWRSAFGELPLEFLGSFSFI